MPILLFLVISFATAAAGQVRQGAFSAHALDSRVRARIEGFSGAVSLYARHLETGESYGIRPDERVRTASTIKLPILVAVFAAVEAGEASWTDRLDLSALERAGGSGVVREMSEGLKLPLRDLARLMIVVSDNTATNMILERFTGDYVNSVMDRLGLPQTRSLRKILGDRGPQGISEAGRIPDNERFGIGVSTPREMVDLLERIERGEAVSPEASREMIAILKRQQFKDGIGRHMPHPVASKSGALDALRSDVGIVYTPRGPVAIAMTVDGMKTDYSPDNAGNKLISDVARILVEELTKPKAPPAVAFVLPEESRPGWGRRQAAFLEAERAGIAGQR